MSGHRVDLKPERQRFPLPRLLLLIVVVLATAWGFSRHFQSVAERLDQSDAIRDETNSLPPQRLELLRDAADALRQSYGVEQRILVRGGAIAPPPESPKTLFIGLDTSTGRSMVVLPPLLARALPPGLAQNLEHDYFQPYFSAGNWQEGLYSCVLDILEALRDPH